MQDFRNFNDHKVKDQGVKRLPREAAPAPVPNEYGGIYDKPKIPKIGFIKARMNKDNFWNIVFFLTVLTSVWAAESIARSISFGFVLPFTIPTLIVTLFLLSKLNPVSLVDDVYTSKSGKSVKQGEFCQGAALFFWALWCVVFFGIMSIALIKERFFTTVITPIVGSYFIIPIAYCILKNIPISIFYHKKALGNDGHPVSSDDSSELPRHEYLSSPKNMLLNPINSWYSGNIHHKRW